MNKFSIKFIALFTIVALNASGLLAIGEALAYFSDNDLAGNNVLEAGILDMTVRSGQGNFVPNAENMLYGDQVNRDIYVGKTVVSLPLKHRVSYEFIDGNESLCNQLDLKIWYNHYFGPPSGGYANRDMRLKYDGPLTSLANLTDIDFIIPHPDDQFDIDPNDGTEQWFFYSIIVPNDIPDSFQGEVCKFNFVFESWQDNVANYGDGGFSDVEKIENTIKVGYWNPPVVLNEFLPNAGNYPEFIEIYNKTNSDVDLQGYKIRADHHPIPINTATVGYFSGGNTTIPAYGWLVVAAPVATPYPPPGWSDILDNNTGTLTLYNPNDIEVDSYTYGNPDHNVNNTPGWTNNLVGYWPFDNDVQDKSGNGNNGTDYSSGFVSGKINQALSFDGVDDYVSIADDNIFDFGSGEFSVESWIKTTSALRQWAVTRYEYYGPGWGLGTQDGHALGYIRTAESGTNKTEIEGTINVSDNRWHHIVMVRTGDKIKLYTDGAFEIEGTLVGDVNDNEPIEIGRISFEGGSQYMSGLIDEVKIYNRALSDSEILEHYKDVSTPSGSVPSDKSFARIPDGSDNWVDPFPTPGGPNRLSGEGIEGLRWQEEPIEEPISEDISEETPIIEESPVNGEIVSADEEVATTTDETEKATPTDEATTTESTTTDEVTTTEATSVEEMVSPEATATEATTTEEVTTTDQQATTTTSASSEQAAREATTTDEGMITEEIATTTETADADENISKGETPVEDETPVVDKESAVEGESAILPDDSLSQGEVGENNSNEGGNGDGDTGNGGDTPDGGSSSDPVSGDGCEYTTSE